MENRFLAILAEGEKARKGLALYALLVIGLSAASFAFSDSILLFLVRLLHRKLVAYDPSEGFFARITSYNVCYTKLLRGILPCGNTPMQGCR